MKIISSDDKLSIFLPTLKSKENINDYLKMLILRLKRNYKIDIFGFYKVNVYQNKKIGMIIDLIKEEEIDFFKDLLDLKITVSEDSDIYLRFNDYFLNKEKNVYLFENNYYIGVKDLSNKEFLSMIEFCELIYGEDLERIKEHLKLLVKSN